MGGGEVSVSELFLLLIQFFWGVGARVSEFFHQEWGEGG